MNGGYFRRESRTVYANELACDKSMVICIIKNSITNQMRCQAIPWYVRLVATVTYIRVTGNFIEISIFNTAALSLVLHR